MPERRGGEEERHEEETENTKGKLENSESLECAGESERMRKTRRR